MYYRKIAPCTQLAPFVETYYIWEWNIHTDMAQVIDSPPTGFASLVVNYRSSYSVVGEKTNLKRVPAAFMSGQATRHYQLHLNGELGMIGVVFKASAPFLLFGIPMYEFNDQRVALADFLGKEGDELVEMVGETAGHLEKITVVEQYLLRRLQRTNRTTDKTDHIVQLISERNGVVSTHEIMTELFISQRQFQRAFLSKVGVSAKYFARIRRVSSICALMSYKKWDIRDWCDIVYQHGYYDQSHFIKDFTEFMGKIPTGYVRDNNELGNYLDVKQVRLAR